MHWEVRGADRASEQIAQLKARLMEATDRTTADALATVQRAIQDNLSRSSHRPGTRTPAEPGSPPSLVSGSLRRSIRIRYTGGSGGVYRGKVGTTIVYGPIQERGGEIHVRTAPALAWFSDGRWHSAQSVTLLPRPFLRPAVDAHRDVVQRMYAAAWQSALHK